jgi:hypothetical protein
MSGPDELSHGSLTWTWVFLGDTKSPGVNDCINPCMRAEKPRHSKLAINRWRGKLGFNSIQPHRFFSLTAV